MRQADDAQKVLKGLSGIAEEKTRRESVSGGIPEPPPVPEIKRTRKWYESLEKPNLSYDDYFDENTGKELGKKRDIYISYARQARQRRRFTRLAN